MILIVGGSHQGKEAFARKQAAEKQADGGNEPELILNIHEMVRQACLSGQDAGALVERIIEARPEYVTMDEVGCGVVPLERKDRDWREAAGRAGQRLAEAADQVYRVCCGIPVQIK